MSGPSTFSALRHRELRLLLLGVAPAYAADYLQIFAIGWLVVELAVREGAPERVAPYLALIGLARTVPGITVGLVGGAVADRVDRRTLLLAYAASSLAVASTLAMLVGSGSATIAWLMAATLVSATLAAIVLPTVYATLPRLVRPGDLLSAIGLTNLMDNLSSLTGPLIGGALVAASGSGAPFVALLPMYAVACLALFRLRALPPQQAPASGTHVLASIREGLDVVGSDRLLRTFVSLSALVSLFGRSVTYLYPVVVHDILRLGAVELSWLLAARATGTLAGSITVASLGGVARRGVAAASCLVVFGTALVLFAAQESLAMALLLAGICGAAQFLFSGLVNNMLQERSADHLRGRVMSVYTTTITGPVALGMVVLGSAASVAGIAAVLTGAGAILALAGSAAIVGVREVRSYRATVGAAADASESPAAP